MKIFQNYIYIIFHLFLLFSNIEKISSISLFSEKSTLYYNKPKTYELDLKDILKRSGDSILGSILFISVHNENEKGTKINLLSKLNSMPTKDSFDHSDFSGINGIYSISYNPCEFSFEDKIYLKINSEKDVDTKYKIEVNTLDNSIFESLCTQESKKMSKSLLYPGITQTVKGIVKFGGKNTDNNKVIDNLFSLHENKTWYEIEIPEKEKKPSPRYGMGIISFDAGNYFLIYGGKDENDKFENDLWVFDVEKETWHLIGKSQDIINFPINSFLPTLSLIENKGVVLSFGSTNILYDNIYTFDIYILKQILQLEELSNKNKDSLLSNLLSNLIKIYPTKGKLTLRYGLSIDQISDNEILFFGGYDPQTKVLTNICEIVNLENFTNSEKIVTDCNKDNSVSPRAFHSTIKYGPTLLLFGGEKSATEFHGDIYKFISSTKKWIKLDTNEEDGNFLKIHGSKMLYNYLEGSDSDKPIIINADNNYILRLSFVRCKNEGEISSDKFCLPCSIGYILVKSKCTPCRVGQYFHYEKNNYFSSSCRSCPAGTYSNQRGGTGLSGCLLCPYNTYNDEYGKSKCKKCPDDKTCLIGSTSPMAYKNIEEKDIENPKAYLKYENYPEFVDREQVFKNATFTAGITLIASLTLFVSFIIFICYCCNKKATVKCLYKMDFIPLTGGNIRKSNGGLITIIYSILICSLAVSFILRYIFWNDIVEVSALDTSKSTTRKELKSSIILEVDVFGEYLPCVKEHKKINESLDENGNDELLYTQCSPEITFGKNGNYTEFDSNNKQKINPYFSCREINEKQCRIRFTYENCETELRNLNTLNIYIKNNKTYISLYKWVLRNYWDNTLYNINNEKKPGYSIAEGIFKANDDITKTKYVFKGEDTPSVISLSLSAIYYSIESDENFSGHRINFLNYQRNELKNEYTFKTSDNGVKLDFKFTVSQNSNIVNVIKDISLLDFFAFMLGILAGFAFLSRVSKHILEKCNCLNYTGDNFVVLNEEVPQNIEMELEKIE
jgi:hypothetical protein